MAKTALEHLYTLCPISIVRNVGKHPTEWQFDPAEDATPAQIAAATAFLQGFDKEPPRTKAELKDYAGEARWRFEQDGITLPSGAKISTDTAAQCKLAAAVMAFNAGLLTSIQFKTKGGFAQANKGTIDQAYAAVVAHVQDGYAREQTVHAAIDAGTITKFAQIDEAFA